VKGDGEVGGAPEASGRHRVSATAGRTAAAGIEVATADDMRALGQRLAALLRPGDLVVLSGPLGAGKTTLVQGIGQGLNVRGPVTSPTFVIARVHPSLGGGPVLVHADAYRLASPAEVDDLDLDADIGSSVTVVEWGEGLVEGLAADRLEVTIAITAAAAGSGSGSGAGGGGGTADDSRTVRLSGVGERWAAATESACCALAGRPKAL
jgi:tRNA threonylcarbamoyladenosine biosynthesis protein TsaE